MRETHAQAYAPWTEAEESDLKRRHHQGETVAAIAARLGPETRRHQVATEETRADLAALPPVEPPTPCRQPLGTKPLRALSNRPPTPTLQTE